MSIQLKITPNGRIVIPADVRKRLGLQNGGFFSLEEEEFGLTLRTLEQRIQAARALTRRILADKTPFTTDEFIAEKRAEAADEDNEFASKYP